MVDGLDLSACVYGFYRAKFNGHAYRHVTIADCALTEAFSQGTLPEQLVFSDSGDAAFRRVGAVLAADERSRYRPVLGAGVVEMSPADAERLVRGSYNTGGMVEGRALPRIFEDPSVARGSGVSCGPLSSAAFPAPLDPIDDLPPATVILSIEQPSAGRLVVRGTTSDNGDVKRVLVNGREATATATNFAEWVITLDAVPSGACELSAGAEDAAGNVEETPHVVWTRVAE
jgi:hypothetical protein